MTTGENNAPDAGNRFRRYVDYATSLITQYRGGEPFHVYLKKYFSANKKHGSRDRKLITSLCYNYFRLGFGVSEGISLYDKFLLGYFLVETQSSPILASLKPEWDQMIHYSIPDKLEIVKDLFEVNKIFSLGAQLSNAIDNHLFNLSFLTQPKLYIRIRPGQHKNVTGKLNAAGILFEKINNDCLAFSPSQKISEILKVDKEVVIQDYNSQRIGEFLKPEIVNLKSPIALWDCCAASGGKSILAVDILKNVELTVSDVRKSILENLKARFSKAGINNYHSFISNLSSNAVSASGLGSFDCIIADVPCSGSGTWGRSPEQLTFFSKESIEKYASLQRGIVRNSLPHLKVGGYFLYITCSGFKKENEDNVDFIQRNLKLELIVSRYVKGYEMQADTLFAALFQKMPVN